MTVFFYSINGGVVDYGGLNHTLYIYNKKFNSKTLRLGLVHRSPPYMSTKRKRKRNSFWLEALQYKAYREIYFQKNRLFCMVD